MRLLALAVLTAFLSLATAADTATPVIRVADPWARASSARAEIGGAFATLINDGERDDALISATSDVCDEVELHTHVKDAQGLMHMEQVDRIAIPSRSRTTMKPGGYHFMLMGLKRQLKPGGSVTITCRFANGTTTTITVPILEAGSMGPDVAEPEVRK